MHTPAAIRLNVENVNGAVSVDMATMEKMSSEEFSAQVDKLTHFHEQKPVRDIRVVGVMQWGLMPFIAFFLTFWILSYPILWPVSILYLIYMFADPSPERAGKQPSWTRKSTLFRWFADYFPFKVHKTADLDPSGNYLFGYHPHGIFGFGTVCAFSTRAAGFDEKFPGLKPHVLTLHQNFLLPFYREYLMLFGLRSVSRKSCDTILQSGPGESIVIVVGGAQESLAAHSGYMDLTLKRRKGFVKVALSTGASLVPVISFGENELFYQLKNDRQSTLYKVQQKLKSLFGFTVPILIGRGFSHFYYGWVPYCRPVNVVIGAPIPVQKTPNATPEQVDALHEQYVQALVKLWDEHKDTYAPHRIADIRLSLIHI